MQKLLILIKFDRVIVTSNNITFSNHNVCSYSSFLVSTVTLFVFVSYEVVCNMFIVQVHPDMNRGDPNSKDKFLRLRDAYTVLSSTELRREYDMQLQKTRLHAHAQTYSSDFTGDFVPPRQSYYWFVIVIISHNVSCSNLRSSQ